MASFFGDLTSIRTTGSVPTDRLKAAQEHCKKGHKVRDLKDVKDYMHRQFSPSPVFDSGMSAGEFPKHLAAFMVSVEGTWSKIDQHGIYVLLGELVQERAQQAKHGLSPQAYRDNLAGAKQHFANGMLYGAQAAFDAKLDEVRFPGWESPMSPVKMARAGVDAQQQAATLRSEKYAVPGKSVSAFASYKSSLLLLSTGFLILANMLSESEPTEATEIEQLKKLAQQIERQSGNLALSDQYLLEAIDSGKELSTQQISAIGNDRRVVAVKSVSAGKNSKKADVCLQCNSNDAMYKGMTCRCTCLCEQCFDEDMLVECPMCQTFSYFVKA